MVIRRRQNQRFKSVVDRVRPKIKLAAACLLITAYSVLLCPQGHAQSIGSDATTPENKDQPQGKAKRVWDEEEIRKLKGGVSVVGSRQPPGDKNGNSRKPAPAAHSSVLRPRGLRFKATTLEGDELTSDSLQGKTVLVQFWTTWCPQCRRDQDPVDRITRAFADDGLVVLAVDVKESKSTVTKYLKQSPRSCQVILGKDTDLTSLFPPPSFPNYVLIDRNGQVAGTRKGVLGEEGLRNLLSRAGINSE